MRLFLTICIALIGSCSFADISLAADFKVTPYVINHSVKQRDIINETITITNLMDRNIHLYPTVNIVDLDGGGDVVEFVTPAAADGTNTITNWLSIRRARTEIGPNETRELPLGIQIHPEAEPGIYHAFIGFGTGNVTKAAEQLRNGQTPGVILTLEVEQDRKEFLKLERFVIDRFVYEDDNQAIRYTLTNPGEATVVPEGEIIISDMRGREVKSLPVNPDAVPLAAGQETVVITNLPIDGMLGKFKAMLSVNYGTKQIASVHDVVFFNVMHWKRLLMILGALLTVTVVLTLLIVIRSRRHAHDPDVDELDDLPVYLRQGESKEADHDVNLRKSHDSQ